MDDLIRSRDWAATPLGPMSSWSPTLRTTVQLVAAQIGAAIANARAEARPRAEADELALLNEAPLGVYLLDDKLRIRAANPPAQAMFDEIPHLVGRDFDEVTHHLWPPSSADAIVRLCRRTLETGESYLAPARIEQRRERGETEYHEWHVNRVVLPGGGHGVVCYVRDISAHVRARQTIAESEARLAGVFASTAVGAAVLTPGLQFLQVNDAFCRIVGRARAALTSMSAPALTHPEDAASTRAQTERLLAREATSVVLEQRYVRADGSVVWVQNSVSLTRGLDDEPLYLIVLCQDITDRRRAEAVAREASEQLRAELAGMERLQQVSARLMQTGDPGSLLHEIVDAAIAVTGADMGNMQVRDASDRFRIVASRGFERPFLDFFDAVEEGQGASGTAMQTGARVVVDDVTTSAIFAGKPAGDVVLRAGVRALQSTPLFTRGGRLVGMLSTHCRRPRRPAERELRLLDLLARQAADCLERIQAEEELREADRAKDAFLAMLGHELRNPVGALSSAARVLALDRSEADAARARAVIGRQIDHLTRLVDDLLDVSRVTTSKVRLSRRVLDLARTVGDAIEALRTRGALTRHEVVLHAEPAWVDADETRVEQIVTNLVGNALKFTPPRGRIMVTVGREGEDAVLSVRDTGIGIPAETLPRVFDLFVQGERTLDRAQGGLGIGLTLVRRLVELHGGSVHATSAGPGHGSVFQVRLPALEAPADAPRAGADAEPPPASTRCRILIVEDNDDAREMLRLVLAHHGHEIHVASDGPGGIAAALRVAPDVALVDVGLPGVDGYEVARRIRASPGGTSVYLVALTGYGQVEDRRAAAAAGFDEHMVKPVDPDRLVAALAARGTARAATHRRPA
jgi:PAS domain S-box-containing protein